jgi:glycosyltransferase involved in cell wall biosynthesis
MRIAIYHNLPSGGAKRALYEWTKGLASSHLIDVYTLSTADNAFLDLRPFARVHHISEFVPHHLFKSPLGRLNQLQYWRNLADLEHSAGTIGEMINSEDYDVVFLNPCQYTFMPVLAYHVQKPSVYFLHEPFGPTFQRNILRPYLQGTGRSVRRHIRNLSILRTIYLRRLEAIRRKGISHVSCLLANSEFTQRQIGIAYGIASVVCPCGVNSDMFHPIPDLGSENFVISVGAMTPRKGFDFLIKSLAEIPLSRRPLLKIASNYGIVEETAYIQHLADEYHVRIQLLTNLDSESLCHEYNKARLCVYSPVMEPFGLVPLEAMACGTPVVGVAEGGVCESIVHEYTGLLTERDTKQFAAAVQELLDDPGRLERYGRQAREYVLENWTWENSTTRLEQYLLQTAQLKSV